MLVASLICQERDERNVICVPPPENRHAAQHSRNGIGSDRLSLEKPLGSLPATEERWLLSSQPASSPLPSGSGPHTCFGFLRAILP